MSSICPVPPSFPLSAASVSLAQLKKAGLPVADISARYEHFIHTDSALPAEQQARLAQLLDYGTPAAETPAKSLELLVIPRLGTMSPWASKATDIAHNCGLTPCAASSAACVTR